MKSNTILVVIIWVIVLVVVLEALALLRLSLSVVSYKKYWDQQNNTSQGEVLFVALGDSVAQGIGASQPQKSYVGLLAQAISKKQSKTVRTINLSVSGATVRDAIHSQLPKLQSFTSAASTIITVGIGANNMRNFSSEQFKHDMNRLVRQLPKQAIIAEVPYFGGGRYRRLDKNVQIANGIIHEQAALYGLTVAPLYEVTKLRDSLLVYSADLFHPNDVGNKNWADAFKPALGL